MRQTGSALIYNMREAARSLVRARLRTLIGLTIGIASVIAMISITEIATAQSRKQFEAVGTDILSVEKSEDQPNASFDLEDTLELAHLLPTISEVAPRIQGNGEFRYVGRRVGSGSVQGVPASFAGINRLPVVEGRFVSDLDTGRYFAVVGAEVARAMRRHGGRRLMGEVLEIGGWLYTVIGVLGNKPESYAPPFQVEANQSVFVPITTLRRIDPAARVELVIARVAPGVHHSEATRDIQAWFDERPRGMEFTITSAEQLIERMEDAIGADDAAYGRGRQHQPDRGGIGVMNIMLISVAERKREIGVRRALGASRGDIQRQFLIEAVILTFAGGIAGTLPGSAITYGICEYTEWESFSFVVGIFFGFQWKPKH